MIITVCEKMLAKYLKYLDCITTDQYTFKIPMLDGNTIGTHSRHFLDFFLCLINSYDRGRVNYDERIRDAEIENNLNLAKKQILFIKTSLDKENKNLILYKDLAGQTIEFSTNYYRELLYNREHTIHHQALIKIAFDYLKIKTDCEFGVAPSTIKYRM